MKLLRDTESTLPITLGCRERLVQIELNRVHNLNNIYIFYYAGNRTCFTMWEQGVNEEFPRMMAQILTCIFSLK